MAVAGTVTTTTSDLGRGYMQYSMAWLCDAGGAVTENAVPIPIGHIHQVKFIPDAGGTAPTNLYDVTLVDAISGGADFLTGIGADLSATARKIGVPQVGDGTTALQRVFFGGGNLYPTVANAGNAKGGTIILIMGP